MNVPAQQPTDHQHDLPASVITRDGGHDDALLAGVRTTDEAGQS